MALTNEDVQKVAHLARLELTAEEIAEYQSQLSSVLAYVDQLSELDLQDVPGTAHAVAQTNVFREDEARASLALEDVLFNAPAQAEDQFLIQAVLDDE
ncbi:MAG TPA: Asp-tRNA(Asn)/Glu-tRNA(Gln) amidotransferase subunit GatC [Candidatus Sulfomarinibacteraceae bacterium]|nr:Asp-tRNA(Asn)/Glu-tRNA(Gln) amidotransferase subunit GatC [Candidatus Sulfomarinibacteraceae bacterium]